MLNGFSGLNTQTFAVLGPPNKGVGIQQKAHSSMPKDLRISGGRGSSKCSSSIQTFPFNIPHVLATFYDNSGKAIWVSDGYVDQALLPKTPVPFSVGVRDDLAQNVQTYRVTVNQYSLDRTE